MVESAGGFSSTNIMRWSITRQSRKRLFSLFIGCMLSMFLIFQQLNQPISYRRTRNVRPLPDLNQSRLANIYQEKYAFKYYQEKLISPNQACPSLPINMSEQVPVYQEHASLTMLENMGFNLLPGGKFVPPCKTQQKTAIIIPFRNREVHLSVWLLHLHPFLQKQNIAYTVFVVNQVANETFNKGILMNSGFVEVAKLDKFDCFIFHDVDLLPEDDRIFYTCDPSGIKHLAYALEEWNYKLLYQSLVGGVVAVTWQDYLRLNGFSNQYFGWGGEDDDFYVRISQNKLDIIRYPLAISRYTMVQHHRDAGNNVNEDRYRLLRESITTNMHQRDGLNNLRYTVEGIQKLPLYTQIDISFVSDEVRNAKPSTIKFPYLKDST
ncbi:beta-1,4-galactosyltransferase 4-like isoform X2 [Watersipora subatra]|uniref:beta-1,4-galactosyltransferase 4-like isoform X2 n=1 Tax=Watersipora subatra TaxID=2589382 RepID=UPI00355B39BB